MRLLLDTHALIWAAQAPHLLSAKARDAVEDDTNQVYVSAASAFEITTKYRAGKLPVSPTLAERFVEEVEAFGFDLLPIEARHGQRAGLLPIGHKDPWDRMLIAQSQMEALPLVSNEALFDDFAIFRYW